MAANPAAKYDKSSVFGFVQFPDEDDVLIQISKTKQDKADVAISVNCMTYHLPRGVDVRVKKPLLGVLQDAIQVEYDMQEDGTLVETQVYAIPFQVKG